MFLLLVLSISDCRPMPIIVTGVTPQILRNSFNSCFRKLTTQCLSVSDKSFWNLEVIILGDLNCDYHNDSLGKTKRLLEFLAANEIEQIIKEPTRVTCNTRSLIDLLVTSTPSLFRSSGVLSTTISDHYPIFGLMNGPAICPHKHRILTTRTWNDESRKNFINDLKKTPWTFLEFFDDVEDMYSAWECLFKSLIDSHFPIKRKRLRKQTHPWLDNSVLRMMRTRDKAHKKAIRTGLTEDWQKYRRLRNQVTSSNRKNRKAYFKNKLQENRANPKAYWNTLHQVLPSKDRSTKIEKLLIDGNQVTNKTAIANSLNQYFTTIASTLLANQPPQEPQPIKPSPSELFKLKPLLDSDVIWL